MRSLRENFRIWNLDEEEIQQIKEANEKREQKELESASEEGKAIVQTDLPQQGGERTMKAGRGRKTIRQSL